MANIHSQKKRILRSERERLENRLHTSTIKTRFRRLEAAIQSGDEDLAERCCVDHIKAAAVAALDMIERSTAKEKA